MCYNRKNRRVRISVIQRLPKPWRRVRLPYPAPKRRTTRWVVFLFRGGRESNPCKCRCPVDIGRSPARRGSLLNLLDSRILLQPIAPRLESWSYLFWPFTIIMIIFWTFLFLCFREDFSCVDIFLRFEQKFSHEFSHKTLTKASLLDKLKEKEKSRWRIMAKATKLPSGNWRCKVYYTDEYGQYKSKSFCIDKL